MSVGRSDSPPEAEGATEAESPAFRRVVEALLEGRPAPQADQEALTADERDEIAALTRTAQLTRFTLLNEKHDEAAEQASLDRARTHLEGKPASIPLPPSEPKRPGFGAWVRRVLGMSEDEE